MLKYLIVVIKCAPILIFDYFAWILPYSIKPDKYSFEKRFFKVQKLIQRVCKAFNIIHYDDEFQEFNKHREDRNYVIICNHTSFMDPLYFIARAKRPVSIVAKKESRKYPFVGRIIRILDGQFLDRDDNKQALRLFLNVQKSLLSKEKKDIIIFPEGTRNKDPLHTGIAPFHAGSFRCILKTQSPVLVSSLFGTFRVGRISFKAKYNPVQLNVKELHYEDYKELTTEELSTKCHYLVDEKIKEQKVTDLQKLKLLNTKNIY